MFQWFRYHLYAGEASEGISAPSEPDVSTFTLDDGRRIGMLICFDLMFASPMDRLATAEAVEAVVFPHYWYDELPFLTAPQAHFGHAVSDNLTILASGHNNLVSLGALALEFTQGSLKPLRDWCTTDTNTTTSAGTQL